MKKKKEKNHPCHPPKGLNPNSNINQPTKPLGRFIPDHIKKSLYMCLNYGSIPPHTVLQELPDEKQLMPLSI